MEPNHQTDRINLVNVRGIGPQKVRSLVTALGNPADIFKQSAKKLCSVEGVDMKSAEKILNYTAHDYGLEIIDKTRSIGGYIITIWDNNYPVLLKKIYDAPPLLYCLGREITDKMDGIAVVGSRSTTGYGRQAAVSITREIINFGLTTVSGLARGIDSVVHRETVARKGCTIAVLGSGLDIIYPPENRKLAREILQRGTIISEFPPGTKPDARNFPQRNRIISGLSHATVVVEAGNRSGAILTALNAIDQNRDVFAVPGRITDKLSVGCLRLISHGAVPVTNPSVITEMVQKRLFTVREYRQQELAIDLTADEHQVVKQLGHDPVHIDDLVGLTGIELTRLLTILLQLELKNAVVQLSGKQFVLA